MKWQNRINKADLHHLKVDARIPLTLQAIKELREAQHKLDPNNEVCWKCRNIARRLGLEG